MLTVQGYEGQANVIRSQGRLFVDAEELAEITNGSLSFEKDRIVLTLPPSDALQRGVDGAKESAFSRPFTKAAIEAMASIREWGGALLATVQNGYPVTKIRRDTRLPRIKVGRLTPLHSRRLQHRPTLIVTALNC